LESSVPGAFVAGDLRHGSVKRVASAVGERDGNSARASLPRYDARDAISTSDSMPREAKAAIAEHLPNRCESYVVLKRCLLTPRARILDSSVCRATPNLIAAPNGPDILPCEAARAASILSRS